MYKTGTLQSTVPPCEKWDPDEDGALCDECFENHAMYDSREPSQDPRVYRRPHPTAFLPHSCSEWVIGSIAEAKALIADLEKFIKENET